MRLLSLKEVAFALGRKYHSVLNQWNRGTLPIRAITRNPARFDPSDVAVYADHGTVTEPSALLRGGSFARAKRAQARLANQLPQESRHV